jgi:hypothetical protein
MFRQMINYKTTIKYIVDYDEPFISLIEYMDTNSVNRIPLVIFEKFVKQLLDRVKLSQDKKVIDAVAKSYSVRNLKQHNFAIHDESNESIALTKFIEMFVRNMSDKMRVKPITDKRFKAHVNELNNLLGEAQNYQSNNYSDQIVFREYLQEFLSEVKQDFETNKRSITQHTDNLSQLLKASSDKPGMERLIYIKIIELCERYVEPFFQFISQTQNENGFIPTMVRLREFFSSQGMLNEEAEIGKFILNFASYTKDIQHVYNRINDYRRKGQQDLIIFNGFEKAFNHLSEIVIGMQDGLLVRNNLDNNQTFINTYKRFTDAKSDNEKHGNVSVNFSHLVDNFHNIEKDLLFLSKGFLNEKEFIPEIDLNRLALDKRAAEEIKTRNKASRHLILQISRIIKEHFSRFDDLDGSLDIIEKLHSVLSDKLENYRPFYTLYAYTNIRKKLLRLEERGKLRVRVGYNQRNKFHFQGVNYSYRPIFIMES